MVSSGLPLHSHAHGFRALGLLLHVGFCGRESLFPNSHPGLEGADSEPREPLTSALSHSPSRPSPCSLGHKGPCACGLSSGRGSGRARARLGSGDILEELLPLLSWSLCLFEAHSPLSHCPHPPPRGDPGGMRESPGFNMCGIKVSSGAIGLRSGSS